jgi:hypothetical protein
MFVDALKFVKFLVQMYSLQDNLFVCSWRDSPQWARASSGRVISPSQRPLPDNTQHSQQTDIHAPSGIRTQSQQANGHRPMPQTARPLGLAHRIL